MKKMKQITVKAKIENWEQVLAFINEQLELLACSPKVRIQIDIAAEELFVNIANYAYQNDIGEASVLVAVNQEPLSVSITFVDNGIPYDPLARNDPDVSLSAEDRKIGGLGIYMVKKSMDNVSYEYKNGQNILTIEKTIA